MDSYLVTRDGNTITSYVGDDAISAFRAIVLASALSLYAKTGIKASRLYTPANMLKAATGITKKKYKRGEYEQAAEDLRLWAEEMKAALPVYSSETGDKYGI